MQPARNKKHWVPAKRVRRDDGHAFFPDPYDGPAVAPDQFAEELAEGFLAAATTGQEQGADVHEQLVDEEEGGPFVLSSSRQEFAREDADYDDLEPEAFPTSGRASSIPPPDEVEEEED